jgi:plastocyanin
MRGLHPILGATVAALLAACAAQSAAPTATTSAPPPSAEPSVAPTVAATVSPTQPSSSTTPLAESYEPGATAPPDAIRVQLGTCCDLAFVPRELTVPAGPLKLFLVNLRNPEFPFDHDILIGTEIGKALARSPVIKHATSGVLTIEDMPAGNYVYWCEVNSHWERGMSGRLTVGP